MREIETVPYYLGTVQEGGRSRVVPMTSRLRRTFMEHRLAFTGKQYSGQRSPMVAAKVATDASPLIPSQLLSMNGESGRPSAPGFPVCVEDVGHVSARTQFEP